MSEQYLSLNEAKQAANLILVNMRQNKLRLIESRGEVTGRAVYSESDLDAMDNCTQNDLYSSIEDAIVRNAAELQAEVLFRVKDPESSELEFVRNAVSQTEQLYGVDKVTRATLEVKRGLETRTVASPEKSDWKARDQLGPLVLRLYEGKEGKVDFGAIGVIYSDTGKTYQVPEEVLPGIPRPATVAVVLKHQKYEIDVEKTLELNPKHQSKRQLRDELTELSDIRNRDRRADQFTLQQIIKRELGPQ